MPTKQTKALRAALYHRISRDDEGEALGVERQQQDTTALAAKRGYQVVGTYTDNDISAAGKTKRTRPEYDAMLASARAGEVDVIVAYSNSRLTRRPRELEDLLDLATDHGVKFATVAGGDYDLATADGQTYARILVGIDAGEAKRISERVTRQKQQRAEQGKPQGARYRLFGYNKDWSINKVEAALVREVFERFLKGESKTAITKDLNKRGVKTTSDGAWLIRSTARMLKTPQYGGLRSYQGEIIGASAVEGLVSEADYYAAQELHEPNRPTGHAVRKHVLSGILICSLCESGMATHTDYRGVRRYRCDPARGGCGKVSIKAESIEVPLLGWVKYIGVLSKAIDHEDNAKPGTDLLEAQLAQVRQDIEDAKKLTNIGDRIELTNERRREEQRLVRELGKVTASHAADDPLDDWDTFDDQDVSVKRAGVQRFLKFIIVKPAKPGRQTAASVNDRVDLLLHDGELADLNWFVGHDLRQNPELTETAIRSARSWLPVVLGQKSPEEAYSAP